MSYHQVVEHLQDTKTYRKRKLVKSGDTGETYTVSIRNTDNRWACSCKGWIFTHNKKGTDCKHIDEIRKLFQNTTTGQQIWAELKDFAAAIAKGAKVAALVKSWQELKGRAELMQFYLENTPGKEQESTDFNKYLDQLKGDLQARLV